MLEQHFSGPNANALFNAIKFGEVSLPNPILVHCKKSGKSFYPITSPLCLMKPQRQLWVLYSLTIRRQSDI
ncbi:hypothetical protein Hanom_Chr04g00317551 [Helianthus anomalus]